MDRHRRGIGYEQAGGVQAFRQPVDPQTGSPVAGRGLAHVVEITEQAFRYIAAGDYDHLEGLMHPRTVQELPRTTIASAWASGLAEVGDLEGFTDSHVELPGGERVDSDDEVLGTVIGATLLDCEAGQLVGRVAVTADLKIAGIVIVSTDHGKLPF